MIPDSTCVVNDGSFFFPWNAASVSRQTICRIQLKKDPAVFTTGSFVASLLRMTPCHSERSEESFPYPGMTPCHSERSEESFPYPKILRRFAPQDDKLASGDLLPLRCDPGDCESHEQAHQTESQLECVTIPDIGKCSAIIDPVYGG